MAVSVQNGIGRKLLVLCLGRLDFPRSDGGGGDVERDGDRRGWESKSREGLYPAPGQLPPSGTVIGPATRPIVMNITTLRRAARSVKAASRPVWPACTTESTATRSRFAFWMTGSAATTPSPARKPSSRSPVHWLGFSLRAHGVGPWG